MDRPRKDDHLVEPLFSGLGAREGETREQHHRRLRENPRFQSWLTLVVCVGVVLGFFAFLWLLN